MRDGGVCKRQHNEQTPGKTPEIHKGYYEKQLQHSSISKSCEGPDWHIPASATLEEPSFVFGNLAEESNIS